MTGYLRTAMQSLVEALEEAPQTPALTLIDPAGEERAQVIEQFNATQVPYPSDKLIHELFEEQVQAHAGRDGGVCEGESLTYARAECAERISWRAICEAGRGPRISWSGSASSAAWRWWWAAGDL